MKPEIVKIAGQSGPKIEDGDVVGMLASDERKGVIAGCGDLHRAAFGG